MSAEQAMQELKEHELTQHTIKATGLTFAQLMEVELLPDEWSPDNPDGWPLSWPGNTIHPRHIPNLQPFAVLKWLLIEPEAWADKNATARINADNFITKETYALQFAKGQRQLSGASEGGKARTKWKHRANEMQQTLNAICREFPHKSYEDIKRVAKHRHGYETSAMKRYCKNPKT